LLPQVTVISAATITHESPARFIVDAPWLSWKMVTVVPAAARGNAAQRTAAAITKQVVLLRFRQ
jgi:hypothetical protein